MIPSDIANMRLASQQIDAHQFSTAKDVVAWMGAMQAQDYRMAKWAVGLRLASKASAASVTDREVQAAMDRGEIIRTHLLRPTWHLAAAEDIYWMLALTAPQIKTASSSRDRQLGLTPELLMTSRAIIEKALRGGRHVSREELVSAFEAAHIPLGDNRAAHLLYHAELDGLICSGETRAGKPTYALLQERAPRPAAAPTREESLYRLAGKYFTSHGPATLADFTWWSGLPLRDARRALDMVQKELRSETIEERSYWFAEEAARPRPEADSVHALPAYDEYLISYADRGASLPFRNQVRAVSINGIFYPVLTVNGQVIGVWRRTAKKDAMLVETRFFDARPGELVLAAIEKAFLRYGSFLEKEIEIRHEE